jgi:hypothetical protein
VGDENDDDDGDDDDDDDDDETVKIRQAHDCWRDHHAMWTRVSQT